ncbi:MAG: DUF599 domain-containing protein [Geminicoccaceae bacterium]
MQRIIIQFDWPNLLAPIFFVLCWAGYSVLADGPLGAKRSLMSRIHQHRQLWMRRMLVRDNRIGDMQIVNILAQSNAFFASTSLLIIGGCLAILGSRDQAIAILNEIPGVAGTPPLVWEVKVLLLVVVFVFAFFKLTWSLRQFNYVAILIGAAPPPEAADTPGGLRYADTAAGVASRAAEHFNKALRTFYFGLAALSWFLQPYLFMALTALVVVVVYRREFRSHTLVILGDAGEPIPGA